MSTIMPMAFISRTTCLPNSVRIFVENALHCVSKVQRAPDGFGTLVVCRHPKGEEWNVNSAFLQSGNVYRAVRQPIANVHVLEHDSLDGVVMPIDAEYACLNAACSVVRLLRQCGRGTQPDYHKQAKKGRSHIFPSGSCESLIAK